MNRLTRAVLALVPATAATVALLLVSSSSAAQAPKATCQLVERKEALAAAVTVKQEPGRVLVDVDHSAPAFRGLEHQRACAEPGARFLASDEPIERTAAALYSEYFTEAGTKSVHVPIVSDFVGEITIAHYQHYFALKRGDYERILAHAPAETNPMVIAEQLRHFSRFAGTELSLKLLRAAGHLIPVSELLRREAHWYWRQSGVLRRLQPAEIAGAWEFDRTPGAVPPVPVVDRGAARRERVEAALAALAPGREDLTLFREASEVGLGDRVSDAVVQSANRFLEANRGNCFHFADQLEAGSGHLPTLLRLAVLMGRCDSTFHCGTGLANALARTPDPEGAVLAMLPVLKEIPGVTCRLAGALVQLVPADAKASTYLTLARAFDSGDVDEGKKPKSCLWESSVADAVIGRLALMAGSDDSARQKEGLDGLVALGKLLIGARGGSELWRHGDRLVYGFTQARNEKAAAALVELAALDARRTGEVRWAATAEAALYLIGGPQAERRAAVMRRYK